MRTLPKILIWCSISGIAIIFVLTALLAFREFRADLTRNQLANQVKMTRIIHQSLNLYFDKLRFITENTVYHPSFKPESTQAEDDLRYVRFSNSSRDFFSRSGITSVLETPRKAVSPPKNPGDLLNWQVFKALPETDSRGKTLAKERRLLARNILKAFPDVHYAFEMNSNGDLVFLEPFDIQKNITSFNYEFRDYLRLAKKTRATAISEGYISHDVQRTQIITVATPVFDQTNKVAKVFAVSVSAATLREKVFRSLKESMNLRDGTVIYLIDRHGHVVASSSGKDIYFPADSRTDDEQDRGNLRYVGFFRQIDWIPDVLESGNVWERGTKSWQVSTLKSDYSGEYINHAGTEVFGAFYPMPIAGSDSLNWGVLIETPKAGLLLSEASLKQMFGIAGFSLALILTALVGLILRNVKTLETQLRAKETEIERMSAQVAHDIRSPLSALNAVAQQSAKLPEDERVLVRSAIGRIREIANQLIANHRSNYKAQADTIVPGLRSSEPNETILLAGLVDSLITEKRAQFGHNVELIFECHSFALFARVAPAEFRRVLSNLIDNSVEATGSGGRVVVSLQTEANGSPVLRIADNGCGISPEILPRLARLGESHGKVDGLGLGLYHAKTTVEALGGRFGITSKVGAGTTVTLHLPGAIAPPWAVDHIRVPENSRVVVIDDDISIHRVWDLRFSKSLGTGTFELAHFQHPSKLLEWASSPDSNLQQVGLFLVDFEFSGSDMNGLDLVERLRVADRSILVTSSYEDPVIRGRCKILGVRLMPKSLAMNLPIVRKSASTRPNFDEARA